MKPKQSPNQTLTIELTESLTANSPLNSIMGDQQHPSALPQTSSPQTAKLYPNREGGPVTSTNSAAPISPSTSSTSSTPADLKIALIAIPQAITEEIPYSGERLFYIKVPPTTMAVHLSTFLQRRLHPDTPVTVDLRNSPYTYPFTIFYLASVRGLKNNYLPIEALQELSTITSKAVSVGGGGPDELDLYFTYNWETPRLGQV